MSSERLEAPPAGRIYRAFEALLTVVAVAIPALLVLAFIGMVVAGAVAVVARYF